MCLVVYILQSHVTVSILNKLVFQNNNYNVM